MVAAPLHPPRRRQQLAAWATLLTFPALALTAPLCSSSSAVCLYLLRGQACALGHALHVSPIQLAQSWQRCDQLLWQAGLRLAGWVAVHLQMQAIDLSGNNTL